MTRALSWAGIGGVLGVLALGALGAWEGLAHGWAIGRPILPPGLEAGFFGAASYVAFLGWLGGGVGMIFGGLTGLGSALVGRWVARRKATRRPSVGPAGRFPID